MYNSRRPRSAARNGAKFNRSVVRDAAAGAAGVLQPGCACIAGIYAAGVAASVNGSMSRGTRFRGVCGGLDTPGSAAGAVSGRYKRRRRRPFPRDRQRSFTRANSYL